MANTLEYLLKLTTGAFNGPLNNSRNELGQFKKSLNSVDGSKVNALGGSFAGLTTKILGAFTAWKAGTALFSSVGKSLNLAADMESTQVAFKTLVGNATKAANVLGQIKKLGAETPFEFPELANAGRMLIAFGESSETVTETLRRIGDVASGIQAPIGDIAEIYGKARTQGTLFAEDINQLTGRGIPIIGQFAKILNVSEGAVKDLASQGKITFPLLDQAFRNMTATGGQFFNMMTEQSGTNNGLMSTLKDTINDLYLTFGQPINEALKPILKDAIGLAGRLQPMVASLGQAIAPALTGMRDFIAEAESGGSVIMMLGTRLQQAFEGLKDVAMVPVRIMKEGMKSIGSALFGALMPIGEFITLKLEAGALKFGSILMQQIALALVKLPMDLGGSAASGMMSSSEATGKRADKASAGADLAGAALKPALKDAANSVMRAISDMKAKMNAEITRFALKPTAEDAPAPATDPNNISPTAMFDQADADKKAKAETKAATDAYMKSLETPAPPTPAAKAKAAVKDGFNAIKAPIDAGAGDDASGSQVGGRRKIISARDGSTKAVQRRGFGTLANPSGFIPPSPKLAAPGAAKNQDSARREQAATASRGGSGDRARWDVVIAIEKHFAGIATA